MAFGEGGLESQESEVTFWELCSVMKWTVK